MTAESLTSHSATTLIKPLLRGWSHAIAAVAAIIMTIVLAVRSHNDPPKMATLLIFGASMIILFSMSAIYHIVSWSPRVKKVLRIFDHTNIFLFIAGTYTPLCFNLLSGWLRVVLLSGIWLLALAGIVVAIFTSRLPSWLSPVLYVSMGWVAVLALPAFVAVVGWPVVLLLLLGGISYTVGAVVYARKWPNPSPRVFGFHEIFHLFVIAGGLIFACIMFGWVLPFQRM